jgi:hypothetical protein
MSFQIETAWVQQYKANIEVQYQQMGSRLRGTVNNETVNGRFAYFDRVTPTAAVLRTTRHGDSPLIATAHDRRRVGLADYEWGDMIDDQDKVRMIADPTSSYVQNAVAAMGRSVDDVIVAAFNATVTTGETGGSTTAYPSASQVAVSYVDPGASAADTNLTIAKLRRVRYLLQSTEAIKPGEMITAAVAASQIESLLRSTEVTSADYNSVKALVNGEINSFMGFSFVQTQRLTSLTGNVRKCYFYPKSAITLAMGGDIQTNVGIRADKGFNTYLYVKMTIGALRMWEEQVIEVACDEDK